jgi:serine acetyltransferase
VIGHDSVIGGNCWIVESIPPRTRVTRCLPESAAGRIRQKFEPV